MADIADISIDRFVTEVGRTLAERGCDPVVVSFELTKLAMALEKRENALIARLLPSPEASNARD